MVSMLRGNLIGLAYVVPYVASGEGEWTGLAIHAWTLTMLNVCVFCAYEAFLALVHTGAAVYTYRHIGLPAFGYAFEFTARRLERGVRIE